MSLSNLTEKRLSKEIDKLCHVKERVRALRKVTVREVSKMLEKWGIDRGAKRIELADDELMHWGIKKGEAKKDHKYIRRYWKNNRWVYVYDDGKGGKRDLKMLTKVADLAGADEKEKLRRSKENYLRETGNSDSIRTANFRTSAMRYNRDSTSKTVKDMELQAVRGYTNPNYAKAKQEEKKARTSFNKAYLAKDQYERSKKAYGKTIMGFSENMINKGKNFINNLFKKK